MEKLNPGSRRPRLLGAVELVRICGLPRAQVARDLGVNPEPLPRPP